MANRVFIAALASAPVFGATVASAAVRIAIPPERGPVMVVGADGSCRAADAEQTVVFYDTLDGRRGAPSERYLISQNPAARGVSGFDIQYRIDEDVQNEPGFVEALEVAAQIWESVISDSAVVVMDVDFTFNAPFIAAASSMSSFTTYENARSALIADASDADAPLVNALPEFSPLFDYGDFTLVPSEPGADNRVAVTTAQRLALGMSDATPSPDEADSFIVFNADLTFDTDPTNGSQPGAIDVVYVMVHELGHALGFSSSTDFVGPPRVWDFFRVRLTGRSEPDTLEEFAEAPRSLVQGSPAGFDPVGSFPGLAAPVFPSFPVDAFPLSTGTTALGDGRQASHWKDDFLLNIPRVLGVMDPTYNGGASIDVLNPISRLDLVAFSVMGWDIEVPCDLSDLERPFGVHDIADVVAYLDLFGAGDDRADIAEPFDRLEIGDVITFLQRFGAGCP